MLVPLSWLQEYVELPPSTDELATRLTLAGLEVASLNPIGDWWDPETIVVGQIVAVHAHPDADRLVLVDVEYGGPERQRVVTGAPNLFRYRGEPVLPLLKAPFARAGALLVDAYSPVRPRPKKTLKPATIRGVRSSGMVCSELELELSEEHEGILLLPADAPVGMPLREYMGDLVLELELTPDMARCLSMLGVAREVAALRGVAVTPPPDEVTRAGDDQAADYVQVSIADPQLCPRYTAHLIRDVQMGSSPTWMQARLRKAGMRPINNIVDITNYVMLELGQPLHAFDYELLVERARAAGEVANPIPQITVRTARPDEKLITLDHLERELDDATLLIADSQGPIALAGVMGGASTEVHAHTRHVLLESATFAAINNRRTAQRLKLHSEASHRFTRGVPATLNDIAARRAAELMRLYAGGRVVPGLVDVYPTPQPTAVVYTTASEIERQLGMNLPLATVAATLRQLDFAVAERAQPQPGDPPQATFGLQRQPEEPLLRCLAPWHRLDIEIPADLTEEVARMVGYDRVETTLMSDRLPTQRRNYVFEVEERIRDLLVGCGLQETINHTLTTPENHARLTGTQPRTKAADPPFVSLTNPPSPERRVLRRTLLVSALENMATNSRHTDRLATFEIGRVYRPEGGHSSLLPAEERRVSILLSGPRRPVNFHGDVDGQERFDFFDLKGVVETLVSRLGFPLAELHFAANPDAPTFGPRCANLQLNGQPLGILGELHPRVRGALGLPDVRVCLAELQIQPLIRTSWRQAAMAPISVYPPVVEDLAFEVREEITNQRIMAAMHGAGGELLVQITLFDVYRGEPLAPGHKSMAYRLTYQSPDGSLSEGEVSSLRQQLIQAVESATGASLRRE